MVFFYSYTFSQKRRMAHPFKNLLFYALKMLRLRIKLRRTGKGTTVGIIFEKLYDKETM